MNLEIAGKTALVTGASSGIGEAVAVALAREGVRLAIAARRADRLAVLADRARSLGAQDARGFVFDQSDGASIDKMLSAVRDAFGDVAIVVLNGGGPKPGRFSEAALDDWDAGYRTVLRGMLALVEGVLPAMRSTGWG